MVYKFFSNLYQCIIASCICNSLPTSAKYLFSLDIVKNCLKKNINLVSSIPNEYINSRISLFFHD